jgi:hypothetical protein
MIGYVYLLIEVDKEGCERHKIGFSKNHPDKRVKQLSTGNSNIITTLSFYESNNYKMIEGRLHKLFSSQKTEADNEWFNLTNEQVSSFKNTCSKLDENISFLLENNYFFKNNSKSS